MTQEEFKNLKQGDVVRGKYTGDSFVVTANYGRYVIAVRTVQLNTPDEWYLIRGVRIKNSSSSEG